MKIKDLELQSERNRKRLVEIVYKAKAGHIGGDLSCLNVLTALYYEIMRVDAHNPRWAARDRFVMSKGNYQEASASAMFMYAIAKAVNKGYIDKRYRKVATDAYDGIMKKLIKIDRDGTVNITQCCMVAGLGGNPYRDGSFEYYISEPIRDNDPKATGPFIMGCIELDK